MFTPATGIKVCGEHAVQCRDDLGTGGANAVFSGFHNSPNGTQPGSNASYGFTWLNGVATSTSVTDDDAETTKLTVGDGTTLSADRLAVHGRSGDRGVPAFTSQPPNWAAKNTPFTAAVTAYDTWGSTVLMDGPIHPLGTKPNGWYVMRAGNNCQARNGRLGASHPSA